MKEWLPKVGYPLLFLIIAVNLSVLAGGFLAKFSRQATGTKISQMPENPALAKLGKDDIANYKNVNLSSLESGLQSKLKEDNFDDLLFMAGFYRDSGKWTEARRYYTKALDLAKSQKDDRKQLITMNNMATTLFLQGETMQSESAVRKYHDLAENLYLRAANEAKRMGEKELETTINKNYDRLLSDQNRLFSTH
jgi:tetratricopeptide (TPR) repeat protein